VEKRYGMLISRFFFGFFRISVKRPSNEVWSFATGHKRNMKGEQRLRR
jgi:hypothetical protein